MALVTIENLSFGYTGERVLDSLCWQINEGDFWYLKGRNGAGKSTLLKIIAGLLTFSGGEIVLDLESAPSYYNPEVGCYNDLSVAQNLALFESLTRQNKRLKHALINCFGLEEIQTKLFRHLSHGQKFRVLLYRALSQEADLYLLDEPIEGLDAHYLKQLADALKLLKEDGKAIVMVSHFLPPDWSGIGFYETTLDTGCLYRSYEPI